IKGVGDVTFLGPRDYSMRIWLDPEKLARLNMTPTDVIAAVKEQNVQVAAGRLGQAPAPAGQSFQLTVKTLGRLVDEDDFKKIVVKVGQHGEVVYLRDVVSMPIPGKAPADAIASVVGIGGSPQGQGPLLAVSALVSGSAPDRRGRSTTGVEL